MPEKQTCSDWENLVKKQLNTEDVYTVLTKENLEGICVKPYYEGKIKSLGILPKIAESTHLVTKYSEHLEADVFAFLVNKDPAVSEKILFVTQDFIEAKSQFNNENRYFSMVDVFNDLGRRDGEFQYVLNKDLGARLLAMPFERSICVDVALHQNAGASIHQQLALGLAKVKELTEVFGAEVLDKIIIKIAVSANYFFEIAKIRALKLLYNQLSKEFGMDQIPFIYAETSLRNKTKNDTENNLIRSALELSGAMIGGADAVFSNDYNLVQHTELSAEISFKQQIVLAYESIINVFEDAGSGSYFLEDITQQFCRMSWSVFLEIEETGGYLQLMNKGEIQKKIYAHAVTEQQWVEDGKIKLTGVNLYPALSKIKSAEEMYAHNQIRPVRWSEMFE